VSAKDPNSKTVLTREEIIAALGALSEELGRKNVTGEICLFGGTVMVLAFSARISTQDVDAVFQPANTIRELAQRIGDERRLPANRIPVKTQYLVEGLFDEGKI
jgi:hypothetical protein